MHGIGEYTWPSGKSFKGTFRKNSIEEGQGVYKWGTHTYDGDVSAVNGMRNGFGKFDCTLPSGGTLAYEGDWKDGRRHGSGKQVLTRKSETTVYEGGWENGKANGEGKMTYPSGNVYEGTFLDGKRHGKGKMNWFNRSEWYEGDWVHGKPEGTGKHVWERGSGVLCGIHSVRNNFYEENLRMESAMEAASFLTQTEPGMTASGATT